MQVSRRDSGRTTLSFEKAKEEQRIRNPAFGVFASHASELCDASSRALGTIPAIHHALQGPP